MLATPLSTNCGAEMIRIIMAETGTDLDDALSDGLCDLMHWAHFNDLSFVNALSASSPDLDVTIPEHGGHDPDGMNIDRTQWGAAMISPLLNLDSKTAGDALRDGLAHLQEWAGQHGFNFADNLRRASFHFDAETHNGRLQ